MKKKILAIVMAASLALGSLVSCGNETVMPSDMASEGEIKEVVYNLASIAENCKDYTIVRGDNSGKKIVEAAVLVRETIEKEAKVELPLTTDWDGKDDNSARLEILIGDTNREASKAAKAAISGEGYSITEDEKGSVIIVGSDDGQTSLAVDIFLGQYFGYIAPEPEYPTFHNVYAYGAVGDGKADDTAAFKKAIAAAKADGLPVYVPAGRFIVTETLTLDSVTMYGYPSGAWTADDHDLPTIYHTNLTEPLINVQTGSISGLNLQVEGASAKTPDMKPTILVTGTGGRVSNMRIHGPYIGIYTDDTSNPGRCFFDNIFIIQAYEMGVYVAGTYDVPALSNIEVWNSDIANSCPVAFKFGHNDDLRAVNLFAFNAQVAFLIEETDTGSCWASFSNCSADYSSIGFRISKGTHHLTVVGGTMWTHHVALHVEAGSKAQVAVSGVELASNGERTVRIEGGEAVAVSGCAIRHNYDTEHPAVAISGGKAVTVSSNTIYSRPTAVRLEGNSGVYTLVGNSIFTASNRAVLDRTKGTVVVLNNGELTGQTLE